MKRFYSFFLIILFALPMFAQKTITGVVTSSEDGLPIIGASVVVKGTTRGVSTDIDGKFALDITRGQRIVFSYVGMTPKEVVVGDSDVINITLDPSSEQLEEIVVTALGIQTEKKKLNFAVQSVNSDALTDGKSQNFVNALQGKIAGLSVTNSSGSPNSGTQIIIRGISSVNNSQNNEPL
ncbi:MAG: carboxypeptidase-like regulatory domain-containing protein, partial [Paludibacteraceae bacterium]